MATFDLYAPHFEILIGCWPWRLQEVIPPILAILLHFTILTQDEHVISNSLIDRGITSDKPTNEMVRRLILLHEQEDRTSSL